MVPPAVDVAEPFRLIYDVVGLRAAPPAFDVFSVLAQPDGTRQINFGYTTTPAPADWLGAEIRYLVGSHTTPALRSSRRTAPVVVSSGVRL